jgi:hypothetical protein
MRVLDYFLKKVDHPACSDTQDGDFLPYKCVEGCGLVYFNYKFHTVDEEGNDLYYDYRENVDDCAFDHLVSPDPQGNECSDIPYEALKPFFLEVNEVDPGMFWPHLTYPYLFVRGRCLRGGCVCTSKLETSGMLKNPPCFDKRPDMNCTAARLMSLYDILVDLVLWHKACDGCMDAVVYIYDDDETAADRIDYAKGFCLVKINKRGIEIVFDKGKAEKIFRSYLAKYPSKSFGFREE